MNDGVREKKQGSVPNMSAALLWEENSWGGLALSLSLWIFLAALCQNGHGCVSHQVIRELAKQKERKKKASEWKKAQHVDWKTCLMA